MTADDIINQLETFQGKLFVKTSQGVEPAAPGVLSTNLLLIRGLLVQLTPIIASSDKEARLTKAAKFDKMIKAGDKKSPAYDALKLDPDLIELETESERIRNYAKYVDGLCTSIQSVLKVQSASDKNQY